MKNVIGIMREGISKRGEKRVAITPHYAKEIINWGHRLLVQSAKHPKTGETKRAFTDSDYKKAGADIGEDLTPAKVIFGLKEIHHTRILPDKAHYFFSHTHKGQIKNRLMLKTLVENRATLIDYELIRDEKDNRLITAFTYNAGYAGMVDTLWTLGKRLKLAGISNPFEAVPQAVEGQDLLRVKNILRKVGHKIELEGTPTDLPPIIVCFLGKGKTAHGAREIFDILPHENISFAELEKVFKEGSRKKVYALQLGPEEIYRLDEKHIESSGVFDKMLIRDKRQFYFEHPDFFESNLDLVLPYIIILMNCVAWSPEYPRSVTKKLMKNIFSRYKTLIAIGDITCDPNGSIEFSKETWIDDPVYIYNPLTGEITNGFDGEGIAVMAVTNLPCEFSTDASSQFSEDLYPFLKSIISADYKGRLRDSNLPDEIKRAVILWKGKFAADFEYMKSFIDREN
ncbi:MAG: hypothetical protein KGZ85_06055 [Ignavibacterium sp.]|nr:hypothetical protein [Ignavibacterium sp.]